ncbi:MAG: hypothetical protein ACE5EH_03865 [Gammaproteobacteria bacterium]
MRKHPLSSLISLMVFIATPSFCVADIQRLVLVSNINHEAISLTPKQIRKLFLGKTNMPGGVKIRPIVNHSDPLIYEVFLQKVVYMSSIAYERQLSSRVFRHGGQRIPIYSNKRQIKRELLENLNTVSFMWASDIKKDNNYAIIAELWQGQIQ